MKLQTYQADSMAAALAKVKADLGRGAVILHTRSFKRGGLWGWRARPVVEITATDEAHQPTAVARSPTARGSDARKPANKIAASPNDNTLAHDAVAPDGRWPVVAPANSRCDSTSPRPAVTPDHAQHLCDEIETIRRMVGDVLAESRRSK